MTKYRKSWSQALYEVFHKETELEEIELSKEDAASFCTAASKAKEQGKKTFKMGGKEYPVTIKVKIPEETELDESAGLQLKMAFDDAGIKIKSVKSGKLVIAKKDKKKVEDIIAKQMKKPADAKRVLGAMVVFEEVELEEEFWAVIDKAKGGEVMAVSSDEKGAKSSVKMSNFSKHDYHFNKDPKTLKIVKVAGSYKKGEKMIGTKLSFKEDVELNEKGTAYPATIDTLRKIVKDKQHQTVMFDKGQALVDTFTASAMLAVYDAMKKPDIKKKFESMIKSKEGFIKTQAFAMKMIK
jgi:nitrate reductase NapAB chaperone NapD